MPIMAQFDLHDLCETLADGCTTLASVQDGRAPVGDSLDSSCDKKMA